MGSLTVYVTRWNVASKLRDQFMIPAADAGDMDTVEHLKAVISEIRRRVLEGDTKIFSDELGAWVRVTEE